MRLPFITRRRHERELAAMQARIDDLEQTLAGYKAPFEALNNAIFHRFQERHASQFYGTFRKEGRGNA
jgi:hypothetical protein